MDVMFGVAWRPGTCEWLGTLNEDKSFRTFSVPGLQESNQKQSPSTRITLIKGIKILLAGPRACIFYRDCFPGCFPNLHNCQKSQPTLICTSSNSLQMISTRATASMRIWAPEKTEFPEERISQKFLLFQGVCFLDHFTSLRSTSGITF